jgi:hypothetical protein
VDDLRPFTHFYPLTQVYLLSSLQRAGPGPATQLIAPLALSPRDESEGEGEGDMLPCGVGTPAREPPNAPHVPWVFDVFAAENNSRAVFIAQDPRPCYTHYRTPDFDMAGKVGNQGGVHP